MRAVKLAKAAAQAEKLRVQAMVRRQIRRGIYGFAGTVFALGALCLAHVAAWLALAPTVGSLWACALLLVFDLVVALILGTLAIRSKPGEIEAEAQFLKERALQRLRQDMAVSALIPALGLFIGTKRARGSFLLADIASRLMRRGGA